MENNKWGELDHEVMIEIIHAIKEIIIKLIDRVAPSGTS